MSARAPPATSRDLDVAIAVAGQGGDGSLTLVTMLAHLLGRRGLHLYSARSVGSRIKGGHAGATLRASVEPHGCLDGDIDLLVAFDGEGLDRLGPQLASDAFVVCDSSWGRPDPGPLPGGATVMAMPFGRFTVRDLRRDLMKNTVALAVAARILGIPDDEVEEALGDRFRRPAVLAANVAAMRLGYEFADGNGLAEHDGPWALGHGVAEQRLLMSGNDAVALGFVAAGGRFFAGYPITPATDIMDRLEAWLPQFGGVAVQVEDELAAINMAAGAALTGTRAMTATSGPGIALMQEGVSHLGGAEIPLVIVDCQRAGPSTGMPTKPEQSDFSMLAFGGNGDFPRLVLAPGDVTDCFELAVSATNLARRLQGPVYLVLDQALAQDQSTVAPFDLDAVEVDRGRVVTADEVAGFDEYRRYLATADGISPWAVPGTPGGMSLVTGNERDEWGRVAIDPTNRVLMMEQRHAKVDALAPLFPPGRSWGNRDAAVGLFGTGMETAVMRAAQTELQRRGLETEVFQPRTLWPVPAETLEFVAGKERVYVVEHNAGSQLAMMLAAAGACQDRLDSVLKYDGAPFRPAELADAVAARERDR